MAAANAEAMAAHAEARACLSEPPTPLGKFSEVARAIFQRRRNHFFVRADGENGDRFTPVW